MLARGIGFLGSTKWEDAWCLASESDCSEFSSIQSFRSCGLILLTELAKKGNYVTNQLHTLRISTVVELGGFFSSHSTTVF